MKYYLSLIILVGLIVGGVAGYFMLVKKSSLVLSALPTTCVDEPEGVPVITSISPLSGMVGTKLEIKGCNFSGFEGDKNVWIENDKGVKGILYGERNADNKNIKITLVSPLCQSDNSYSGKECEAKLNLTPGQYKIYTMPWGKKSNEVRFVMD